MNRNSMLKLVVSGVALVSAAGFGQSRSASAVIITVPVADYQDDYQPVSFAPGWSYVWNSGGALGTASNYTDMLWNGSHYDSDGNPGAYDPAPANYLTLNANGGHPGYAAPQTGSGGFSRYPMAAFTVTQDGDYTISDSFWSIANSNADDTDVNVYVNNMLINSVSIAAGGGSNSFDGSLGSLLAGDTIYVAEGSLINTDFGSFKWDFTINHLAEVPEPSTLLLASVAMFPLLSRRRRARKSRASSNV